MSLTDRCNVLSETVKARDSSLSHAQDKIKSLTDRVELLKTEAAANHAKAEKPAVRLTEEQRNNHSGPGRRFGLRKLRVAPPERPNEP